MDTINNANTEKFIKEFNNNIQIEELSKLYSKSNKLYTEEIFRKLKNVLISLGYCKSTDINGNMDKSTFHDEYYRIDLTAFNTKELKYSKCGVKLYNWNLEIAIEHENNYKEWFDEAMKLSMICCPLRVLIGYVPIIENKRDDREYLSILCELFESKNEIFKHNLRVGDFLIILGNGNTSKKTKEIPNPNFKFYELNHTFGKFTFIEK